MKPARYDIVLVGGGLQNSLIALAALHARPELRIAMVEREHEIGGNHTWCFHATDVPPALAGVVDAITAFRWDGYTVRFRDRERTLAGAYAGTCAGALATAVRAAFARSDRAELRCGIAARAVAAEHVDLETGERLYADLIVDARGPDELCDTHATAYQKFVGLELELARRHHLERPLLMDAAVPQIGGFRFFYVLPLAPDRVLVEDTRFARDPELAVDELADECMRYVIAAGLAPTRVLRSERGVLAMPWSAGCDPPSRPLVAGYQGGWFHPATGYSFPIAARLAAFIASRPPSEVVGEALAALWRAHQRQVRFCHLLNRLVFGWFAAQDAWHVFERFYRLPAPVIRRFYALEMTAADRARILCGRPPRGMSVRAALAARFAR